MALWLGLTFFLCLVLFHQQFMDRGGIINYNQFTANCIDIPRWNTILIYLKIIQKNFLLGVGLENTHNFIPFAAHALNMSHCPNIIVHNIYLLILAETGIIGFSFFVIFILSILMRAVKNLTPLTLSLLCCFVGLLIIGCFDFYLWRFQSGRLMFFITAGFLSGLSASIKQKAKQEN